MNHHHDHQHHHRHNEGSEMSTEAKLFKLLEHWMQHNEEHAKSYDLWARRATLHGLAEVGALLEKAAEKTRAVDDDFKAALAGLKNKDGE